SVCTFRFSCLFFFFSSRRRHTRFSRDWSSDVCSSDLRAVRNAARSLSATVAPVTARACSCPLLTPSACPSSSSASTSGVGTPASASVRMPRARSSTMVGCGDVSRGARLPSPTFGTEGGEARLFVHLDARVEDRLQGAVHHLVEVVGLVSRSVVGDPVLGEVVGADAFGAVHRADLAATLVGRGGIPLLLLPGEQPRAQHAHTGLAVLQLRLLVLHRHDDARG